MAGTRRKSGAGRRRMPSPGIAGTARETSARAPDGQEEPRLAGDPALAIGRDAAAGNEAVQMRMVHPVLPPGVKHSEEADFGAEMFRIGGDDAQCLRGCLEQNVVDCDLVLKLD